MFVPNMPGPIRYHEDITSYQIVEYHPGETPADLRFTVLYNSSSARMTWFMLREISKHTPPKHRGNLQIHVMFEGKLHRMHQLHFNVMVQQHYLYLDQGEDTNFIEWIEVHEPQRNTTVTVYSGTWYETFREVAKWSPERRKQVYVAVMRQDRPLAEYNPPYVEYAYLDADAFWKSYDNWCALMTYDKHADYVPWPSDPDYKERTAATVAQWKTPKWHETAAITPAEQTAARRDEDIEY